MTSTFWPSRHTYRQPKTGDITEVTILVTYLRQEWSWSTRSNSEGNFFENTLPPKSTMTNFPPRYDYAMAGQGAHHVMVSKNRPEMRYIPGTFFATFAGIRYLPRRFWENPTSGWPIFRTSPTSPKLHQTRWNSHRLCTRIFTTRKHQPNQRTLPMSRAPNFL